MPALVGLWCVATLLAVSAAPALVASIVNFTAAAERARAAFLGGAELLALYRWMVLGRTLDERMITLQRQGRIGFYIGAIGEEATVFGTVAALGFPGCAVPSENSRLRSGS